MNVREASGITGLVLDFSLTFRFKARTPARILSFFPQQLSTRTKFVFSLGLGFKTYFYFPVTFLIFHFISEHIHQSHLKFDKEAVRLTSSLIFHQHVIV
jgi:hypothetical protein